LSATFSSPLLLKRSGGGSTSLPTAGRGQGVVVLAAANVGWKIPVTSNMANAMIMRAIFNPFVKKQRRP
jgi:hypothetical protein